MVEEVEKRAKELAELKHKIAVADSIIDSKILEKQ